MEAINIQELATELAKLIPITQQSWPRWLSLKKAAEYSNVGQKKLIELASNGKIRGYQDPGLKTSAWVFDKESIDEYRLEQSMLTNDDDEKASRTKRAVAILDSVGI